jgi:hypothetical protein
MGTPWEIILFILAVLRVGMEFTKFDLNSLPIAKKLSQSGMDRQIKDFHKMGFYLGVGYVFFTSLQWILKIV